MKSQLAIALVLAVVGQAGQAQSPSSVPAPTDNAASKSADFAPARASMKSAVFYMLMFGRSEESSQYWSQTLGDPPLTSTEIQQLRDYAERARSTNLQFQHREMDRLCATKAALTTLDAVADALTSFDANNEANIEQLGGEALEALGPKLGNRLQAAVPQAAIMVAPNDHKKLMIQMNKEPIAHIARVCSKTSSSNEP